MISEEKVKWSVYYHMASWARFAGDADMRTYLEGQISALLYVIGLKWDQSQEVIRVLKEGRLGLAADMAGCPYPTEAPRRNGDAAGAGQLAGSPQEGAG